jgi:hypothetical protein
MSARPEEPCHCPICDWEGRLWSAVESRPGVYVRKACPRCGSYPRDRIVWQLLHDRASARDGARLKVVEVGESGRAYLWKRRICDYWNADIVPHELGYVDVHVDELGVRESQDVKAQPSAWMPAGRTSTPRDSDIAVLAYVLSALPDDKQRLELLRKLHRATSKTATLILFDDLELDCPRHQRLASGQFFHAVRLGRPLLSLLVRAAWHPTVVKSYAAPRLLAHVELPLILATKDGSPVPA